MISKKITRRRFLRDLTLTCTGGGLCLHALSGGHAWGGSFRYAGAGGAPAMEYRTLGRTGLKVSALGFGAMRLTEPAVLFEALDLGVNYFDTAHRYQNGNNEKMLGSVLKQHGRSKVLIATKIPPHSRRIGIKLINDQGAMESMLEESLRRLQTDYVDVLFLHSITEPDWPLREELLEFCRKTKAAGKTRFVGISFHTGGQTYVDTIDRCLEADFYDVFLATLNYKSPRAHIEALERARRKNVGVVAMKTQAGGYSPQGETTLNPHQAALRWALDRTFVDCAIPGMVNRRQLVENAGVMGRKVGWSDRKTLAAYYETVKDRLCVRCGACSGTCQKAVNIAAVHRCLMYWEGYSDFELGRQAYREMSGAESARECMNCSKPTCRCVNGIRITDRMRHAHLHFS